MDATSLTLLDRLKCGDNLAWEQFHDLYGGLLWSAVNQLLGRVRAPRDWSEDDHRFAKDVFQDTVLKVLQNLRRFDRRRDGSFRKWLRTIVIHQTLAELRKAANRPAQWSQERIDQELVQLADPHHDLELLTEAEYNAHLKQKILARLQHDFPKDNIHLFLRLVEKEISPQQAARELGISVNAVNLRKFQVVKKLREYFNNLRDLLG